MSVSITTPPESKSTTAYYEGYLRGHPPLMAGKLMLVPKYLVFHVYDVRAVGILERAKLIHTGKTISIPLHKIVDATAERRLRSRWSRPNWKDKRDFDKKANGERGLNEPPRPLDTAETYEQVVITVEADSGVEIVAFEVEDAERWVSSITSQTASLRL